MIRSVAIQMDHVSTIDIEGDSTFVLGLEAQKRGYKLYHYEPGDLSLEDGRATARAREMELRRKPGDHHGLGEPREIDLARIDVILMRQDPPFDMSYVTATHILERVHPETLVVNNPREVRNAPEKLLTTTFAGIMPPTLISKNPQRIKDFRNKHRDIVVKPLFGNGGAGVFHLKPDDENLNALLEMFAAQFREPLMAQAYLPEVRNGDKRIILIDGEPVGALNRVPAEGEARSNMHVGGKPAAATLTERDRELCAIVGPTLRERGLVFVGVDVIGNYMTEINVTSPTGLQEINGFDEIRLEARIWDAIEEKL